MGGIEGEEAEEEAGGGVESHCGEASGAEEEEIFVGEGGESGEAAAEANGEEQAQCFVGVQAALYQPVDEADDGAPGHVDGEGAPGEVASDVFVDCARGQIAERASEGSAEGHAGHVGEQRWVHSLSGCIMGRCQL